VPRKTAKRPKSSGTKSAIKRILAIDIGGTGLKAAVIGPTGKFVEARMRLKTPPHCTPKKMVPLLLRLVKDFKRYDRVSIGFPGYVRGGKVFTAPHLGTRAWSGFKLEAAMQRALKKPTKLLNDADVQGLAAIKGKGLELVCTLGTGLGTAMFQDGVLLPHMDLSHMAIHAEDDFDVYIGDLTLKKIGAKDWNKRIKKTIAMLHKVFFFDHLYLGGGNARKVKFPLPRNVSTVSNDAGMEGGAFIWLPKSGPQ
jgi:polyphosphate glucokinase